MRLEPQLRHRVAEVLGGREFFLCFQCGRCTSHCPVFNQFPQSFNPRRILEKVAIGYPGVLDDPSIWRCTTCYECFEHCPWGINLGEVLVALRNLAVRKNGAPKEVAALWAQVKKGGFILAETERIRKMREDLDLEPLNMTGVSEVEVLANAIWANGNEPSLQTRRGEFEGDGKRGDP